MAVQRGTLAAEWPDARKQAASGRVARLRVTRRSLPLAVRRGLGPVVDA
jgi:hypothetical protein